jgi:hypothetical protein
VTKVCTACGETKSADAFTTRASKCRPCKALWHQQRRAADPQYMRRKMLWTKYRLTIEQWENMHDAQLGRCATCLLPLAEVTQVCVDHDHACCPGKQSCGKCLRKILCSSCNFALGHAKDNPEILRRMISYLEEHSLVVHEEVST